MTFHTRRKSEPSTLQCEEEVPGIVAFTLIMGSVLFIVLLFPLSLFCVIKVVQVKTLRLSKRAKCIYPQEYERAVIFRLGRLIKGGARGPGVFFIIPCVDTYEKIDMRSMTFEIPPQEVQCNPCNLLLLLYRVAL